MSKHSRVTVFLTSYNRPQLVQRALNSLIRQDWHDWRCVMIDDGSNKPTQDALWHYANVIPDSRFDLFHYTPTPEERAASVRYSILLNEFQALANPDDIVVHMCDNVEYTPDTFARVVDFFNTTEHRAGYVLHQRDIWRDGRSVGPLSDIGHSEFTPDGFRQGTPIHKPLGVLDHSQVFFRWPVELIWPEEPQFRSTGDGVVFSNYVRAHGPIHPIPPFDAVGSMEHFDK